MYQVIAKAANTPKTLLNAILAIAICCASAVLNALTFSIHNNKEVIGSIDYVHSKSNDTLYDIAREFDLGTDELIAANPKINPNQKLVHGTNIILPAAFILPPGPRQGIVLNLSELRIYYFHPNSNLISTFPIGIGRSGWRTPVGETKIVRKRKDPTWIPPDSIRRSHARKGKILPPSIGPGPDNPLGAYAMNLAWPRYVIHGTNQPDSVGKRSSSGCIRLYPEDIKALFNITEPGTTVRVIHEPVKVGVSNQKIYIEVHQPLPESYYGTKDKEKILKQVLQDRTDIKKTYLDWRKIRQELKHSSGYPVAIGTSKKIRTRN